MRVADVLNETPLNIAFNRILRERRDVAIVRALHASPFK
jgi:hypothetical protein